MESTSPRKLPAPVPSQETIRLAEAYPNSRLLAACPSCRSKRLYYAFSRQTLRVVRCEDCDLLLLNPRPVNATAPQPVELSAEVVRQSFEYLSRYRGAYEGNFAVIGECDAGLVSAAAKRDPAISRVSLTDLETTPAQTSDCCIVDRVLEQADEPLAMLQSIHRIIKPGGSMMIATPSLDSPAARRLKQQWTQFNERNLALFDSQTIQNLLYLTGFEQVVVMQPPEWGDLMLVMATAANVAPRRKLSIVLPAFNEAATIGQVLDNVLSKNLLDLEIEVIAVESNSSDGTREVIQRYAGHPRLKIVLEDRPRGKGHAVRAGLEMATGDFILIQDADMEYDFEDYDVLLEPLVTGRQALVLGSRHGGRAWWKMRQFAHQPIKSLFFNFGHWVFTTLLNKLFGQRLLDPFTMYKVFRRDCLHGLEFQCNRFDFDYELLIKMLGKGYHPLEIPVNYRSRSFDEGKKISTFRDPITWLWAMLWLRLSRPDILAVHQRKRSSS
jgi:SAM-dependent methyltransferase